MPEMQTPPFFSLWRPGDTPAPSAGSYDLVRSFHTVMYAQAVRYDGVRDDKELLKH